MDDEDRKLCELLRHAPIPDDGFSARALQRIRRREALRHLLMPLALLLGGIFAVRPVLALFEMWSLRLSGLTTDLAAAGSLVSGLAGVMTVALPLLLGSALVLRWLEE